MAYAADSDLDGHHRALVTGELDVIHDSCRSGSDSANSISLTGWGSIEESLYLVRRHRSDLRPTFPLIHLFLTNANQVDY